MPVQLIGCMTGRLRVSLVGLLAVTFAPKKQKLNDPKAVGVFGQKWLLMQNKSKSTSHLAFTGF